MRIDPYGARPQKSLSRCQSIFRCAAIRLAVVRRTERNQQCNRLCQASQRSHRVVIRVYDEAGNVIETQEHAGGFKDW